MGDGIVGRVKGSNGKEFHVKWEGGMVQVKEITGLFSGGWQSVGHASSGGEAMRMAEAYVYNK
jgi:hypothetical protein